MPVLGLDDRHCVENTVLDHYVDVRGVAVASKLEALFRFVVVMVVLNQQCLVRMFLCVCVCVCVCVYIRARVRYCAHACATAALCVASLCRFTTRLCFSRMKHMRHRHLCYREIAEELNMEAILDLKHRHSSPTSFRARRILSLILQHQSVVIACLCVVLPRQWSEVQDV